MIRLLILTFSIFLLCFGHPIKADCTGCTDNGCSCIGSSVGQRCDQSHCVIPPRCDGGGCNQDGTTKPVCCLGYCSQVNTTSPKCVGGNCNQDGAEGGPVCTGGECSQVGTDSPVCTGGDCDQSNSVSPKCTGGSCTQVKARGTAKCVGGSCNTAGAESVNCLGGSCCLDGTEKSISCLGGSCNANARSCQETGCGGSPCDNTFPSRGLSGSCNAGDSVIVYPWQALKLLLAIVLIIVLYQQCKPKSQGADPEMQQPLLNPNTEDSSAVDPTVDTEANQEAPITAVATVITTEEPEVTESAQDTAPESKKI